jgi:1,4-alpha-glucan branching enzyme
MVKGSPHTTLGLHPEGNHKLIRLLRPGSQSCFFELRGEIVEAYATRQPDLFVRRVDRHVTVADYRVYNSRGQLAHDPYAFLPTFGELDAHLFHRGVHYELYNKLGARPVVWQGIAGVQFAVWAPNAQSVALVADFNQWDGRCHPMRSMGQCGVWELFVPGLSAGEKYKYEIRTQAGHLLLKADPMAHAGEMRPRNASVVADLESYVWKDAAWMEQRAKWDHHGRPMSIYEVHLGSWRPKLSYREMAHQLAAYCKEMGFTHVELLPIMEHPFDGSWGYQVTGFFAATSRYGTPADFQYFVDTLHQQGIGVLLDWVPAHFPCDDWALARFDGTALYEHADPKEGFHPHWNTYIFNYGRSEVCNFLIASALFWCEKMHIDGLRVDAVASMLYRDYGRNEGEWVPNVFGGKENLEAIQFLKHLNSIMHRRNPGVLMIAEESTSFSGVSHSVDVGGLGFDFKWNMGWMNDTLSYFNKEPIHRSHHQNNLTFGLLYAFSERFINVLSHDEVVHGKRHLLDKMPGDDWQRFANLRLLLSYMMCQPGKKLLFMGSELGQWHEWSCERPLDWHLLEHAPHRGIHQLVRELHQLYHASPSLWEKDHHWSGFDWVHFADHANSILCYRRKSEQGELLCLHNFTPTYHPDYFIPLSNCPALKEVFNTDAERFGGSSKENGEVRLHGEGFSLSIPPLATLVLQRSESL